MDFSWDWVKPGLVMTTGPLVKARLKLARTAMPQVTRRPAVANQLVLARKEQGWLQRPDLAAPPA